MRILLQSLHTTVLPIGSSQLFPLEVQIRSRQMQKLAEFGIAGKSNLVPSTLSQRQVQAQHSLLVCILESLYKIHWHI